MSITKHVSIVNEDATTSITLSPTPLYTEVPCRLSFPRMESPQNEQIDETPIMTTPKLFCDILTDIHEADVIVVSRKTKLGALLATYKGIIGLPNVFTTHKEVLFLVKESA